MNEQKPEILPPPAGALDRSTGKPFESGLGDGSLALQPKVTAKQVILNALASCCEMEIPLTWKTLLLGVACAIQNSYTEEPGRKLSRCLEKAGLMVHPKDGKTKAQKKKSDEKKRKGKKDKKKR